MKETGIENIGENIKKLEIPKNVVLIAVSKKKPVEFIEEAYNSGQKNFGENYIQEAIEKIKNLSHLKDIRWHFIGHLQSNKAKIAAQYFHMIQCVDSKKIAKKIDNACAELNKKMPVLVEVNIGNEENKSGILKKNLEELLDFIASLKNLELKGLMCIPPANKDPTPYFKDMKRIYDKFKQMYELSILSMGMSGDYKSAINEGSNMVRIGTAIFGSRN
ncbi:MAG: YggS family pyridoxal phosphate-dependent enzyme [Promethearchaeota archaeon]